MNRRRVLIGFSLVLVLVLVLRTTRRPLRVLVATSMAPVVEELGADVRVESGASLALVRRFVELDAACDVLVLADAEVFGQVPASRIEAPRPLATARLVLVGPPGTPWYAPLVKPGVRIGRADPEVAPLGYRTHLALHLAEEREGIPGLAATILGNAPPRFVRSNVAALAAMLEAGEVDYAFDYEPSALARKLPYTRLPVDFADEELARDYGRASLLLGDATVRGAPIRYAAAVSREARDPEKARAFVERLAGARDVLARRGFVPLRNAP